MTTTQVLTPKQTPTSTRKQKLKAQTAASPSADDGSMRALGIGIDTARYGHHGTFLREDKQLACPPMIVMPPGATA